jgi:ankyrin repeat protein
MTARFALLFTTLSLGLAHAAPETAIRDAANKAIALLQQSQSKWKQDCSSCHHQFQPAIAFRDARMHGLTVDETIARADALKAFAFRDLDQAVQYNMVIEPAMDDAYRLMAAHAAGFKPNLVTAVYARLIAARQDPAGHWDSFHQRPPSSYSRFTQTTLALRAIQLYSHPSQKADVTRRLAAAQKWLVANKPRDSEERTYQLMGLHWTGASGTQLAAKGRELLATQQPDGGWISVDGRPSDAYSTAQALVALNDHAAIPTTNSQWQRGLDYLLRTQLPDGSWHVSSRIHPPAPVSPPYFESGYPHAKDQFISAQASSWAAMALARALPLSKDAKQPVIETVPDNAPIWAEAALFGSAADLANVDANATSAAGTSVLMMAAPDAAKMKALIDHGANVNARAKSGYSALMVAAQYLDSDAAISLLLSKGAQVTLPEGTKSPMFGAYPLFLAAYAGNSKSLAALHKAGDNLNDIMVLIGTSSVSPLVAVARYGNERVARELLALGADVDGPDGSGISPLGRAALGNQVETAKLLIAHGAKLDHVDNLGMTPLLYAASIDFGDAEMVKLLLKAGANPSAKSKQGRTALELAETYGHTRQAAPLRTAALKGK